jgi:hypothetical protein
MISPQNEDREEIVSAAKDHIRSVLDHLHKTTDPNTLASLLHHYISQVFHGYKPDYAEKQNCAEDGRVLRRWWKCSIILQYRHCLLHAFDHHSDDCASTCPVKAVIFAVHGNADGNTKKEAGKKAHAHLISELRNCKYWRLPGSISC